MPRRIDVSFQTSATPEQVWRAITEPEEIAAWFSPEAKVEPGVGGSITFAWDDEMKFATPITAWEPGAHLQTGDDREKDGEVFPIRIDYFIETEKGQTTLRLVHSGFGDTADWDNEIAGYEDGWAMFMAILSHRLKHADQRACQATVYRMIPVPRAEVWEKLSHGLLELDGKGGFRVEAVTGAVEFQKPNFFRGVIPGWRDAMLSIFCEGGGDASMTTVALLLFGETMQQAESYRATWSAELDRLFPAA